MIDPNQKLQLNIVTLATHASTGKNGIYYTTSDLRKRELQEQFTATLQQTAFDFQQDEAEFCFMIEPGKGTIWIKNQTPIAGKKAQFIVWDEQDKIEHIGA